VLRYVGWWSGWWGVVVAAGVGLSFVVWSPGEVATLLCTATLCVGVLLWFLVASVDGTRPTHAFHWSRLCSRALVAGAAVVAVAAYIAFVPSLAWPLAGLAVATSPPVVDRVLRWRKNRRPQANSDPVTADPLDRPGGHRSALPPSDEPAGGTSWTALGATDAALASELPELSEQQIRELGTQELCQQWRRSFLALEKAGTAAQRMRVVAQRQLFLDEMDRRSPTALAAWLASGARAAGGPERFLNDDAA
jgi:hypothetical protein